MALNFSTWDFDTVIGCFMTSHVTVSEHGGVVREPLYV
jgi:hypothetical protein